ncbi:helix-turn-helix domain-containing protein [Mangrovihabitans endophyticus]|uniref:HTH luxR-type domain-containing protein n=1 Tax=Mangrovihabitans endophyticus TaxID=1751298 RepID=A0A8J3BXZ7_9ACTN|nr:helix-turn-helix transcriptional regulator [Mangrovihabitans endophyticus]GGK91164.1 hypothetical protein GCM10012284_26240 [Mangrovihabitans endophyticus]
MSQEETGTLPHATATPSLARWGLSVDADLVYRTMATFGARSAPQLSAELGLPPRRVHAALAELHEAGAAARRPDRPSPRRPVWASRPCDDVVARLRERRMQIADREAQASAHRRTLALVADGGHPAGSSVRHLPSRAATRARLADLVAVERHEHLAMNTEQAFDAESTRAAAPLDRVLAARGVRIRVIGLPPADRDLHVDPQMLDVPRCAYREADEVPLKLLVIDRRIALFPADPRDLERGYLEVSQPTMVRSLVALFDRHWASAADPREHGMPHILLSDRERELIALLAQGHTDVTAAEHLRISSRSVTNIMRGLMDRVGVENRFQLGLALGAAGAAGPRSPRTPPAEENR